MKTTVTKKDLLFYLAGTPKNSFYIRTLIKGLVYSVTFYDPKQYRIFQANIPCLPSNWAIDCKKDPRTGYNWVKVTFCKPCDIPNKQDLVTYGYVEQ